MKVRFLVNSDALGGAEHFVLRLAAAIASYVDVTIASGAGAPVLAQARAHALSTEEVSIGRKLSRRSAAAGLVLAPVAQRRLRELVSRWTQEGWCVLQFKWEELLWGGEVAPTRVCLIEHGPIPAPLLHLPPLRRRLRRAFLSAGVVFAVSVPAQRAIRALCGRDARLLQAGVNSDRVAAALARAPFVRRQLRIGDSQVLLTYAGRVVRDKGVLDLVWLTAGSPDRTMLILGDGPAMDDVRRLARRLRVDERVLTLGPVADPLPYLAASDATVLVSRERGEGRPLLAVESLALGVPLLGLASPAVEALEEEFGESAIHVLREASPEVFAEALRKLAVTPRPERVTTSWDTTAELFLSSLAGSPVATPVGAGAS